MSRNLIITQEIYEVLKNQKVISYLLAGLSSGRGSRKLGILLSVKGYAFKDIKTNSTVPSSFVLRRVAHLLF
jgi:hypothetical protein